MMEVQPDFKELLKLLNAHAVEYVIVGGYALAFHGVPRYTGDIDILINPTVSNSERIWAALDEFGFGSVGLSAKDFQQPDKVIQLGVPPVRVDLITSITGVSIEEALTNSVDGKYGDVPVRFIGRDQFITNKRATGRLKDKSDLAALARK